MTRLMQEKQTTMQKNLQDSLAALSSPSEYLDFALSRKLTGEQVRTVAFTFLKKFGQYAPATFSFSNIQKGAPQGHDELVALLGQSANNFQKGE